VEEPIWLTADRGHEGSWLTKAANQSLSTLPNNRIRGGDQARWNAAASHSKIAFERPEREEWQWVETRNRAAPADGLREASQKRGNGNLLLAAHPGGRQQREMVESEQRPLYRSEERSCFSWVAAPRVGLASPRTSR
jgi:hypothetical protein